MKLTITVASVKVMRSHDYCHFEVNLAASVDCPPDSPEWFQQVDGLRKNAARLADKAVEMLVDHCRALGYVGAGADKVALGDAMHLAENGQIVLAAPAFALVREFIVATEVLAHHDDGQLHNDEVRLADHLS